MPIKLILLLFVIPLLCGGAIRYFCRNKMTSPRAITVGFAVLTLVLWSITWFPPAFGNEGYALRAFQGTSALLGSVIVGLFLRKS